MDVREDATVLSVQVLEDLLRVLRQLGTAGNLSHQAAATLTRVSHGGPLRLTELAIAEGISQPGMTQLVTRLGRDGLVRRLSSPEDGRVVLVEATPAGRALIERRRAQRAHALVGMLEQLDESDRRAVHDALPALGRLLAVAMSPPSPGTDVPAPTSTGPAPAPADPAPAPADPVLVPSDGAPVPLDPPTTPRSPR